MAGIGEASAIVAVAQAGISLSMVIIAYVGDVKDAPSSVSRIGNEIKSTSGRLEEIAEIIRDNPHTRLLLDTAVGDATRCSSECELILAQVGNLLVKGGWKRSSTGLSKEDIDTSVVASLKWPFLKTRLDTPRVELQRIKADLILLFNVAMARKSSTPLTNEYARKIPLLTKKKEEAARRAEEARHKARESQGHDYGTRTRSPRAPSRRAPQIAGEDPELSQQFWEFELQRAKEQEDRRIRERAALLQAENDQRKTTEEDQQREIARKAIEDYKLQQEELKAKTVAREKQLSDELFALGLRPEQVASVLAVPSLNVDDLRSGAISRRKSTESQRTSLNDVTRKSKPQPKRRSGFAINFLPWRGVHDHKSYDSESNSVGSNFQGNETYQYSRGTDDEESIELWLVDVFSRQHTELAPSERWMSQKLVRIKKSNDVWHRFSKLQPMWRVAIQDFLEARNKSQRPENAWKLIHIGLPRRMTKMSIFGHHHGGQVVRLVISQCKSANDGLNSVVVIKSEKGNMSPSNVRACTYLPRRLVSVSAIRESSYDYKERFVVPSDDITPQLKEITDETHIMIPEALSLKQVNMLASLTKSYMEIGRVPWEAQPPFTYTFIGNDVRGDDQKRMYGHTDYDRSQTPGGHTPVHRPLVNQQRGPGGDLGPHGHREPKANLEGSINYLKQQWSIINNTNPEDRVWLHEIDAMISVLQKRLARLDSQTAKIHDYERDNDVNLRQFRSQSKPDATPAIRSSEERFDKEAEFQSRGARPASPERRYMGRSSPSRRLSDREKHVRQRLNASLAERGLEIVLEPGDLGPFQFVEESRKLRESPPPPRPSPQWLRESHRRRSADSGGADKRSLERNRPTSFEIIRSTRGESDAIPPQRIDTEGRRDVFSEDPVQREERRVVFKDRQRPSHYTGYDENDYGRETDGPQIVIDRGENNEELMKGGKSGAHEHGMQTKTIDLTRPTYTKVHRKYLSPETLDAYEVPWEWMEGDPDYVLIKQWIPESDQHILFQHSRRLRKSELADLEQTARHYKKKKSEKEKPKRDMSFEKENKWPDSRNSQALVLREPRGRFSSREYPSRKSTYDYGIRIRGYADSRSPSPDFDPYDAAKKKLSLAPPLAPPTLSKSFDSRDQPWNEYDTFSPRPRKPFLRSRVATQSRAQAPGSVESIDDDEDDHVISGLAKDGSDDDADLIAKTLSRYTTFKVEEDVTAGAKSSPPAAHAPMSPTTRRSRSSTPSSYSSTLKYMKSSLEKMQIAQSRAEEEGDVVTTSDLQYYAIPEMQSRIKEKEDEARTRAEAAEDDFAGPSNRSKKTRKAVPISLVQRRGILNDSPTKDQNDRSGERLSHSLKKMKSTDDLRNEDLADLSIEGSAAENIRKQNTKQNTGATDRLDNDSRRSTGHSPRRPSRSPSQSGSEREPLRRADTQLYEADSEGSGGEAGTFERRDTWRRPTVEDEGVVEEVYEVVVEEEVD